MTENPEADLEQRTSNLKATIIGKLWDAENVPGYNTEFTPEEADIAGAFEEVALDITDAWESTFGNEDANEE